MVPSRAVAFHDPPKISRAAKRVTPCHDATSFRPSLINPAAATLLGTSARGAVGLPAPAILRHLKPMARRCRAAGIRSFAAA
jgi:hypothetical protein